jgi:uncharacterized protein YukE
MPIPFQMSLEEDLLAGYTELVRKCQEGFRLNNLRYESFLKFFSARISLETSILAARRKCLRDCSQINDPMLVPFLDDLKSEADLQEAYVRSLESDIHRPLVASQQSSNDMMKKMSPQLTTFQRTLDGSQSQLAKAKRSLAEVRQRAEQCLPKDKEQVERQLLKEQRSYVDVYRRWDASKIQFEIQLPQLFVGYEEYNSEHLRKFDAALKGLRTLKGGLLADMARSTSDLLDGRIRAFEAENESAMIVEKVFDPTLSVGGLSARTEMWVVAIDRFRSEALGDLNFDRGDKILVVTQHTSGWWEGEIDGKRGLFPFNYVVQEDKKTEKEPIDANCLVIEDYHFGQRGELELLDGDFVVVDFLVGERCIGENLRTGRYGQFPVRVLDVS